MKTKKKVKLPKQIENELKRLDVFTSAVKRNFGIKEVKRPMG